MPNFTLAIIAGGKSSRMGQNKAFVKIGEQLLIERIFEHSKNIGQEESILITNTPTDYKRFNLPMYADVIPDSGSLGGIFTALHHSKTSHTIVIACDMPFISADLLKFMMSHADKADVIVPTVDNYPQGLHAIYSQECIKPIRDKIDVQRLKVIGFYDQVRVTYLNEATIKQYNSDGLALMNVNTPEELKRARQLAETNPTKE